MNDLPTTSTPLNRRHLMAHEKNMPFATAISMADLVWKLVRSLDGVRGLGGLRRRLDAASMRLVMSVAEAGLERSDGVVLFKRARADARLILSMLDTASRAPGADLHICAELRLMCDTLAHLPRAGPRREIPPNAG